MGAVGTVAKRGYNEAHNYNYATESDITDAVRHELAQRLVTMSPTETVIHSERMDQNQWQILTGIVTFEFNDGESGESHRIQVPAQGTDKGDKAAYKLLTGAEKYALLKTFLIPTGDDPEATTDADRSSAAPAASRPAQTSRPTSGASQGLTWPAGHNKGKPVTEVPDKDLEWWIDNRWPDPADERWYAKNKRFYDAVVAERERRAQPA
jgi:hypothetical protein